MHYCDLLERMKRNDTEAFLEMTERYGWSVYSAIREKYPDREQADKIYNETMNAFYHSLAASDAEDPLEALLHGLADRISPDKLLFEQEIKGIPDIPLCQRKASSEKSAAPARRRKGIGRFFGVLLILVILAGCVWIAAGYLMRMHYIPYYDLGYSWLYANVMQFFQ